MILIVDLLYGWIDPRIRITDEGEGKRNYRINRKELFQRVDLTHSADREKIAAPFLTSYKIHGDD